MGNCGDVCKTKILNCRSDIIIEGLLKERDLLKFDDTTNLAKLIFLQLKIKKFLKKKKHSRKNITHSQISNMKISKNNTKSNKNFMVVKKKNSSSSITNFFNSNNLKASTSEIDNSGKKYTDEYTEELLIPTMKIGIENIFEKDDFRYNSKKDELILMNSDDPRDGPMDDIRRKFPKIQKDMSSYEGEWKNGKRDGFGVLCWEEQSKFCGLFTDNKVFGFGILYHKNEDVFKGNWEDFHANGLGTYETKNGIFFQGYWKNDRQNGVGFEKWPRGGRFIGEYIEGNKEGVGILKFENMAKYEGEFRNGIISGVGTFYFGDNKIYRGTWENNRMHGYGIISWDNGNYFEGMFNKDKKEGFGIHYSRKKIIMGFWKNNELEGNVIIINDEGEIKKQVWKYSKPQRNLPIDTKIIFEKYADELVKKKKKTKSDMNS